MVELQPVGRDMVAKGSTFAAESCWGAIGEREVGTTEGISGSPE